MTFLHTRIRVSDMDQSIAFYKQLGFDCVNQKLSPQGNKLAYLSIKGEKHLLELCWSADYTVNVPDDLMHTCVGVDDIIDFCDQLEGQGIEIWPSDWRTSFISGQKMAFVSDPDGYEVEILANH